jgi:hypothetical protein
VKKRREEWWECPNLCCGAQILFLMIGPAPNRANPSCFCGSTMLRVVRMRRRRGRPKENHAVRANDTSDRERASTHPPPESLPPRMRRSATAAITGSTEARHE